MNTGEILSLDARTRIGLWQNLSETIEAYFAQVSKARAAPDVSLEKIRSLLAPLDFAGPFTPGEAMDFVVRNLWDYQVHTPHPRYFGLFNPAPAAMGIAADTLVAAFNPQLATFNHSPFAVEVEQHLLRSFGQKFGYDAGAADGTFTSGGAEANLTALLTALVHTFPPSAQRGLRGIDRQPVLYISTQSHHSLLRAAQACGLGSDAIAWIPVDHTLRMNVGSLARRIARDRADGLAPFLVVATAGTTNAGIVDPILDIADVAAAEKVWLHVDAAWGGAAIFVSELRPILEGIERSDSITFDAHKWLSVPMAAGMYLTRHPRILRQTFYIPTEYMPTYTDEEDIMDPYNHSIQWSRRFIGLKVFLSLLVAGWDGYRAVIEHQIKMGELLRRELESSEWEIVNQTELPIVCFVDRSDPRGKSVDFVESIAREVVSSGEAWISTTRLDTVPVLRACITNYRTEPADVRILVHLVNRARRTYYG